MANSYMLGSAALDPMPKEQAEKIKQFYDDFKEFVDAPPGTIEDYLAEGEISLETKELLDQHIEEHEDDYVGFQLITDIREDADSTVVFCHDESINPAHVATFVSFLMEKGLVTQPYFTMEFAAICDKPQIGEFFGSAIFVTKDSATINWFSTGKWVEQQVEQWEEGQKELDRPTT